MSVHEDLKSKYGRNNSSSDQQEPVKQEFKKTEEPAKHVIKNTPNPVQSSVDPETEIAQTGIYDKIKAAGKVKKPETKTVKFLKILVYICIIATVLSIITAFLARTNVNTESEEIIEQVRKAEDLYFQAMNKYCYFSKTRYNDTLGVDLSKRKYFTSYEVVPNIEFGNYEIKLYGATNAFTITYYVVKNFVFSKS